MTRPTLTNQTYWTRTTEELRFISKDAREAAAAMRGFDERAENKYLEQVCDAATVLSHRKAHGLTPSQIDWAKTHDWFIGVADDGVSVHVLDRSVDRDGKVWNETMTFADYRRLRDWAGY